MRYFEPITRRNPYDKRNKREYYNYSHYRLAIAEDCKYRCGYCDCHQNEIGGEHAMEMDHFRPWNKSFGTEKSFAHLKNDPNNLIHSCGVCNGFKLGFWPTELPQTDYDHEKGWIDPFTHNRNAFFHIEADGTITPLKPPSQYIIKKLRLNRPLLKKLRILRCLWDQITAFEERLNHIIQTEPGTPHASTAEQSLYLFGKLKELTFPSPC